MRKETLALILILVLSLSVYVPVASAHNAPFPADYDSTHLWIDTIGDPESLDPAWAYDAASSEVIQNVYETLIFFDVKYRDGPYNAGKTVMFVPTLASALPTIDYSTTEINPKTGEPYYSTWYFPIRTGIPFHPDMHGNTYPDLTPEDVEYSFEREMVMDRSAGPQWMLFEPLLGAYYATTDLTDPYGADGIEINNAVKSNSTHAWFNLVGPYPELAFKQIMCQSWASVVCKAWAVSRGDFDGDWTTDVTAESVGTGDGTTTEFFLANTPVITGTDTVRLNDVPTTDYTIDYDNGKITFNTAPGDGVAITADYTYSNWSIIYQAWHNPPVSFLNSPDPDMVGTGPYMFFFWNSGTDYSIVWNPDYWRGWPAPSKALGGKGTPDSIYNDLPHTLGGYLEEITWRELASWAVRRANFLGGSSDMTYVPRPYKYQVLGQDVGGEKIRCYYPVGPVLALDAFFFTFDVSTSSKYAGVMNPPGTFSTAGMPPNLFGKHSVTGVDEGFMVRKAFAYAFDYVSYNMTYNHEGSQPADPVIPGLAYDNVGNNRYNYARMTAQYYLKLAWGGIDNAPAGPPWGPEDVPGALWNGGMKFQIVYNIGNVVREVAATMLANEINSWIPTKFFLEPLGLDWGTVLTAMVASELPLFLMGWSADFTDPHDFVFPFQHSLGTFAQCQRYGNPVVDALVQAGIATPDDTLPYTGVLDVGDPRPLMTNWYESTNPNDYITNPIDSRWPRRAIYYALQAYYHDDVPSFPIVQPIGRHWEIAWMRGWYYNPLYGGSLTPGIDSTGPSTPTLYVYHLWKAKTHFGDVSSRVSDPDDPAYGKPDGIVSGADMAYISAHYTPVPSTFGFHVTADVNGGLGGILPPPPGINKKGFVRGLSDGNVDILDLGLVNAYWDNPHGPSHPP